MKSEKEKMALGEPYKAFGGELFSDRQRAKEILFRFNNLPPAKLKERQLLLKSLFGKTASNLFVEPPLRCDYGYNVEVGKNFYANYNLTLLDAAKISIGNGV